MPKLIRPTTAYKDSFIATVREFQENDPDHYFPIITGLDIDEVENDFDTYIERCLSGEHTPEQSGWVKATYMWLLEDDELLGIINIRHELNDHLRQYGGHIGYGVRPSQRRKGYASDMLRLSLPVARDLGIVKLLLICDTLNIGSQKVIEANGGILEKTAPGETYEMMYWWIDIA